MAENYSLSTSELAEVLLAAIAGAAPGLEVEWPVYLALRGRGRLLAELWSDGKRVSTAVKEKLSS